LGASPGRAVPVQARSRPPVRGPAPPVRGPALPVRGPAPERGPALPARGPALPARGPALLVRGPVPKAWLALPARGPSAARERAAPVERGLSEPGAAAARRALGWPGRCSAGGVGPLPSSPCLPLPPVPGRGFPVLLTPPPARLARLVFARLPPDRPAPDREACPLIVSAPSGRPRKCPPR
jgi:hypothetical protein